MSFHDDKAVLTDGRYTFREGDYGRPIPFQLYDEDDSKFDASSYTGFVKLSTEAGSEVITEISPSWTTQNEGTGTFAFTSSNKPSQGRYILEVQLEKSGEIRSFACIHPIGVIASPSGSRQP